MRPGAVTRVAGVTGVDVMLHRNTVPDGGDLWLKVLQYIHDHPVSGHFG